MSRVLITGCGLTVDPFFRIWGDLWEEGDCYVFNACGEGGGLSTPFTSATKQLIMHESAHDYFARRNVYVVAKDRAELNAAAIAYIARCI